MTDDFYVKGWSRRGEKEYYPGMRKSKRYTLLAAISSSRQLYYQVLEGSYNSILFTRFILDLVSHRNKNGCHPSHSLILFDNFPAHKGKFLRKVATESHIPILFTPSYSCVMAPIELYFSFIKS